MPWQECEEFVESMDDYSQQSMTLETVGTVTVAAAPQQVLEFVCDLDRYRQADTKIAKVIEAGVLANDGTATCRYKGRLRGITSPADRNDVWLTRWSRVDFTGSTDSVMRRVVDFHGWFTCEETDAGTLVTHGETFSFKGVVRWPMERYLRTWLHDDVAGEMARLAELLGRSA
jgi:Polyketide cyclase / dehydrase and lipid transport